MFIEFFTKYKSLDKLLLLKHNRTVKLIWMKFHTKISTCRLILQGLYFVKIEEQHLSQFCLEFLEDRFHKKKSRNNYFPHKWTPPFQNGHSLKENRVALFCERVQVMYRSCSAHERPLPLCLATHNRYIVCIMLSCLFTTVATSNDVHFGYDLLVFQMRKSLNSIFNLLFLLYTQSIYFQGNTVTGKKWILIYTKF